MVAADDDLAGAPLLRGEFRLADGHGTVTRAWLHLSALGVVEALLDGRPVSDELLTPGWSSYEWRLRYRTYDVSAPVATLTRGTGVLGLRLGNGWYRGRLGWTGQRALYGPELAAIAELEIHYADGFLQRVGTDETWRAGPSAVLANDLYDGQTVDARLRDDTWTRPGARLGDWVGVHAVTFDPAVLTEYLGPPVLRQETLPVQRIWTSPAGRTLVDFGQNLVGWVRLHASGPAGTRVTVRHAEVLEDGELGTRPLRSARAQDEYVLSGNPSEPDVFEPTLTFHGFRYVSVDGFPGTLGAEDLEAVVVHSDLERTGTFTCSNPMVEQLHRNVVWGMRGNFLDVPTDCPQRDERLGWTGDLAVFAPTAAYLYDVRGFLDDWLADLACEQEAAGGLVPFTVPDALKHLTGMEAFGPVESAAIWSDAAVWVPWALWEAYGDREALERHFPAMLAHLGRVEGLLSPTGLWDATRQFGDWLDPDAPPGNPAAAKADPGVVATAALYRSLTTATRAASVLGRHDDSARLDRLGRRVRAAFREHYVGADGHVHSDCQTAYTLAIHFGLLQPAELPAAGRRLAALVESAGYRISTGFAGTPYVLHALTETGHVGLAYRMLLQPAVPGWMYPITMGATTVWERWDSMLPDGSVNPGEMTSFNHYALGAVADWLHRVVAGIGPLAPGYREVLIAPRPGPGVDSAGGSLRTPHGTVSTHWSSGGGTFALEVEIPDGVTALVRLPAGEEHRLTGPAHRSYGSGA